MAAHRFKKGDRKPPTSGRKKGVRNKLPRALRELVQDVMVDAGRGETNEDRAREYLLRLATSRKAADRAMFIGLLKATIEKKVEVSADLRETVRIVNLTGLNLADPKVRKRLGPSILGHWPGEEKTK